MTQENLKTNNHHNGDYNGKENKKTKKYIKEEKINSRPNRKQCSLNQPRCMSCHILTGLPPHHIVFKSQGGDDRIGNLIVLCFNCHRKMHDGYWVGDRLIFGALFMIKTLEKLKMNLYKEVLERLKNEI